MALINKALAMRSAGSISEKLLSKPLAFPPNMLDELYCYPPDFTVLKNKFEITNQESLDKIERLYAAQRIKEECPTGDFDLNHLTAIHHHIFQDVYSWAG